ncbi:type II toxin-antitoxin system VapC family toxin [Methylocystis parvus]|uniref:Type II toxin-antitoxin system VapC family toxin n=1 Tax=Methylocystis parvus TaxID=134 RepID=A0A6B8M3E0_9HYPH|nr:type II toxin-antitoxin system VapC family toxin [Methylocystis parvus]QGM96642.1 type II toxin-antitoxin system VapC family toxin [Methylocystis parvus]WBJ99500.1 type II toxin-antitoxin system VapC family toxin [Methylocystis parvus OBBP]
MTALLLDTHAWVWSLTDDPRLSARAREAVAGAGGVNVSPISFFEISQKARLGKWPEMAPYVDALPKLLVEQGGLAARLNPAICTLAGSLTWAHRDPFDRLIAATSILEGLSLVSVDAAFDGVAPRIWSSGPVDRPFLALLAWCRSRRWFWRRARPRRRSAREEG